MGYIVLIAPCILIIPIYLFIIKRTTGPIPEPRVLITPQSTIITFDIHGVLFNLDWKKIMQLVWRNKRSWGLITYIINPRFLYNTRQLAKKGTVLENIIIELSNHHPYFGSNKSFIYSLANAQKPIPSMIDLLEVLKKEGYSLHIFSNIGLNLYADLAHDFPAIFTLFDQAFTPDGLKGKQHTKTFVTYLKLYNPEQKQVIFVDNNKNNVHKADYVGILGVYYKNTQQLETVFKKLEVL